MNLKLAIYIFFFLSCVPKEKENPSVVQDSTIVTGAEQIETYLALLQGKKIGLVVNQTSLVNQTHLLDTLIDQGIKVSRIFSPEHGFRGEADAGEKIDDSKDGKTGIEIVSLYGDNKKPKPETLKDIDIIVFDIQDVGVRFYTYISTLHYVMEAAAEESIPVIILDRPNPNAHYVDGPVLEASFKSFVGMHPVPVVYGMTIGEYGQMINGESWLEKDLKCELTVIPLKNYVHSSSYDLPVKPSPNLPNAKSILLYPSLCFFEGTDISIGRGTDQQFQHCGHPELNQYDYHFTPAPNQGAKNPKHKNKVCFGKSFDVSNQILKNSAALNLDPLIEFYNACDEKKIKFFTNPDFFDLLAGTDQLRNDIISNKSLQEIRTTWSKDLEKFKQLRVKYLLYN